MMENATISDSNNSPWVNIIFDFGDMEEFIKYFINIAQTESIFPNIIKINNVSLLESEMLILENFWVLLSDLRKNQTPTNVTKVILKFLNNQQGEIDDSIQNTILNSKFFRYFHIKYNYTKLKFEDLQNFFPSLNFKNNFETNPIIEIENHIFFGDLIISKIYKQKDQLYYDFKYNFSPKLKNNIKIIWEYLQKKIFDEFGFVIFNFEERIMKIKKYIQIIIKNTYHIEEIEKISWYLAFKYVHLENFMPFLLDDKIEEIFLDQKGAPLYLSYQNLGFCETNCILDDEEIQAIISSIKLESNKPLSKTIPSLMYVIKNSLFYARFSVDIFPLHWKNISLDIRKLNRNFYSVFDLIELKSLNKEIFAFLFLCLINKINITIVGEVNSGKTTLLNALDMIIPKFSRKIYLEETIETIDIPFSKGHQLKYLVPAEISDSTAKERAIYRLLHRTADYVILGEILSEKETKAMFHCLSAGIVGLQTTHSQNINSLLNRWLIHFKIEKSVLNDLGIVIFMKKIKTKRLIYSIEELEFNRINGEISVHNLFQFSPISKKWNKNYNIQQLGLYKKLNLDIPFSIQEFSYALDKINEFSNRVTQERFTEDCIKHLSTINPKLGELY